MVNSCNVPTQTHIRFHPFKGREYSIQFGSNGIVSPLREVDPQADTLSYQRQQFLNETLGQLDGKPFTGKDFLRQVQSLVSRDYKTMIKLLPFLCITFPLVIAGPETATLWIEKLLFCKCKSVRYDKLGASLKNLQTVEGKSLNIFELVERAHSMKLIYHTSTSTGSTNIFLNPILKDLWKN